MPGGSVGTTPFETQIAFPVDPGAKGVLVKVEIVSSYPGAGRLPRETADLTVNVTAPSGPLAGTGHRDVTSEQPGVSVTFTPSTFGTYVAKLTITGGSDGSSAGDKYVANIQVHY